MPHYAVANKVTRIRHNEQGYKTLEQLIQEQHDKNAEEERLIKEEKLKNNFLAPPPEVIQKKPTVNSNNISAAPKIPVVNLTTPAELLASAGGTNSNNAN